MTESEQALYQAIASGNDTRTLEMIRDNPELLSARLPGNRTPILEAALRSNRGLVDALIVLGAQVDLITAIVLGRTASVQALLQQRPARIHKHGPNGWSILHFAAAYGEGEMLHLLVSLGMNPNDSDNDARISPLFLAGRAPFTNAKLLLAHGADINARAKHGNTPLHHAAAAGLELWADFLLCNGADPDVQTKARQTPWALAVRYGHHGIAQKLTAASRSRNQPGHMT